MNNKSLLVGGGIIGLIVGVAVTAVVLSKQFSSNGYTTGLQPSSADAQSLYDWCDENGYRWGYFSETGGFTCFVGKRLNIPVY